MALQVWLPLTKDLRQQGLSNVTIINNGATYSSTGGKLGGCYIFDGVDDAITVGNLSTLVTDNFSFACWFYHDDTWSSKNYETIFGGPSGFELEAKSGSTNSPVIRAYSWGQGTFTYELNKWNHLVMTRTTSETKFYLNGELKLTGTAGTIPSGNYFVGSWSSTTGQNFKGKVNDVRIYNHCLSSMEVKELAKGLVLHYPLSDRYIESTTNLASASVGGWDNSGASSRNTNDTSIPNKPTSGPTASSIVTTQGNCAFTCATTGANYPSKTLTFSLWYWQSGPQDTSTVYIRSSKTDGNVGNFEYNGSASPNTWPKEKWIYLTKTITTASDATSFYICTYINPKDSKRAYNGWQIEEKDHATPWTAPGTTRVATSIIYDTSGFCNNGTSITETLTVSTNIAKYQVSTHFNGTYDGILIENLQLSDIINSAVTYAFWIKPENESGARSVYFGSYSTGPSWSIEKTAGNVIRSYWNGSPDETCNGATITDGVWQHVCLTKSGTNDIKVYINGVQKWASTATHSNLNFPTTFRIGRDTRSNDGTPYKGLMSDFRIYATALSANDIKSLYNNNAYVDASGNVYGQIR